MSTIALLVSTGSDSITLVEALSDEQEIALVAGSLAKGEVNPLATLTAYRTDKIQDEERFADYVEELACKPALKTDIKEHCVNWLNSRTRMEEFMRREHEATRVIADYAYKILLEDPSQRDFVLASPKAQVRVQVFELPHTKAA